MQTRLADRTGFVAIFIKPEFTSDVGEARGIHRAPVLGLLHTRARANRAFLCGDGDVSFST